MVKIRFYPLDIAYKVIENKPQIQLFGRTEEGKHVCVIDESFEPYFYVLPENEDIVKKIEKLSVEKREGIAKVTKVEKVSKKILGKQLEVLKVFTQIPSDVPAIRGELKSWASIEETYEYDIPFTTRYLIDRSISFLILTEVEGEESMETMGISSVKAEKIVQLEEELKDEKVIAFDIETYSEGDINAEKNPIIMLSFYGERIKKVFTWKRFKTEEDYIEFVDSESELIQKFADFVKKEKPDILTGYFSDGFDLPYIEERAKKYKINLDIGLDKSEMKVTTRRAFNSSTKVKITGINHIDILDFIRKISYSAMLEIDFFDLNNVSMKVLGEGKVDVDITKMAEHWQKNTELEKYCKYNLKDSELTYRLTKKFLPIIAELSKITGMTLFDVNRVGFSQLIENYIMKQAFSYNEICMNKPNNDEARERRAKSYEGAFVYEPEPGFYKDIFVFDFRSLYPSIISSHNISPETLNCECCKDDAKRIPNEKTWYCEKKRGFIPSLIENIITRRMRIKGIIKEGEKDVMLEAREKSLKLLANAFYGYLGFFGARWYCFECASSVTSLGRYYITKVIDEAKANGFEVIYSDTDSIFLKLDKKTKQDAMKFCEKVNTELPGLMELEYDGFYPRGIFVSAKATELGAKKKYALVDEKGNLKITGFETIRRNWSPISKEVQENVLKIILKEDDRDKALEYVKKIIKEMRENKIPVEKTIISTQLQKEIESYESISPHVAIAQKMRNAGITVGAGSTIKFIVTVGKGKIRDKAKLPSEVKGNEYDPDYYINNQIIPAIERIFEVLDIKKEEFEKQSQSNLGSFM